MDLADLETLATVVEAGGFHRAARRLLLTQPAVSQIVKRLEERLGTRLLERTSPPVPTPAGRRVLEFASRALDEAHRLERDLADLARTPASRLHLGASQLVSELHLPRLLPRFLESHPEHGLDVLTFPSRELVTRVRAGEVELGFGPFQHDMPGLARREYFRHAFHLYASRRHPRYRALRAGEAEALRDAVLVTSYLDPPENRPGRGRLRYRFASVWQVSSLDLRLRLIREGRGIGYLPEGLIAARQAHRGRDGLEVLTRFEFGSIERSFGIYRRETAPPGESAARFIATCDRAF